MPVIVSENISRTFNKERIPVHALRNVDVSFEKREFTAIVGPSGSGKTTLLNIIGGLDTPTEGKIIIENTEITALPENQLTDFRLHHIGFVFQSYNLIPVLSASENVEFILMLQGVNRKERRETAENLLNSVGLKDKINSRITELSGGQQQRVAVARALASNPKFVLADEPTANLDSISAGLLLDIMHDLNRNKGMTFIFSSHDQRVIERADRIITLHDGMIESDEKR